MSRHSTMEVAPFRKFDGKKFELKYIATSKKEAENLKQELMGEGYYVRVLKQREYGMGIVYLIYARKGRKR